MYAISRKTAAAGFRAPCLLFALIAMSSLALAERLPISPGSGGAPELLLSLVNELLLEQYRELLISKLIELFPFPS